MRLNSDSHTIVNCMDSSMECVWRCKLSISWVLMAIQPGCVSSFHTFVEMGSSPRLYGMATIWGKWVFLRGAASEVLLQVQSVGVE